MAGVKAWRLRTAYQVNKEMDQLEIGEEENKGNK